MALEDETSADDAADSESLWKLKQLKITNQPRGKLSEFWSKCKEQFAQLKETKPDLVKTFEVTGKHNACRPTKDAEYSEQCSDQHGSKHSCGCPCRLCNGELELDG